MRRVPYILLALVALIVLGLLSSIVTHGFEELARVEVKRGVDLEERSLLPGRPGIGELCRPDGSDLP